MTNEKIVSLMRTKTEVFQTSNNWISVSLLRFLVVFGDPKKKGDSKRKLIHLEFNPFSLCVGRGRTVQQHRVSYRPCVGIKGKSPCNTSLTDGSKHVILTNEKIISLMRYQDFRYPRKWCHQWESDQKYRKMLKSISKHNQKPQQTDRNPIVWSLKTSVLV